MSDTITLKKIIDSHGGAIKAESYKQPFEPELDKTSGGNCGKEYEIAMFTLNVALLFLITQLCFGSMCKWRN